MLVYPLIPFSFAISFNSARVFLLKSIFLVAFFSAFLAGAFSSFSFLASASSLITDFTTFPSLKSLNIALNLGAKINRAIKFGTGRKEVLYCAATHANEWITAPLLMKFLENISKSYVNNLNIFGYNARELFNNVSLYIVPMVNPDGVDLVTGFFSENSWAYTNAKRIASSFPDIPFPSGWKANIEGIDFQKVNPIFSSVIIEQQ